MTISRAKFAAFATLSVAMSLLVTMAGLLVVDLYAHSRVERSVGVNRRGYRGPAVGRKQPGELRIVMLGGSTVFGYGVAWDETIPAYLERALTTSSPGRPIRVINLGFIGEGVYAFLPTLQDFDNLDYDIACLYEGYNDLNGDTRPNVDLLRHQSPVFRLTGYYPVLPLALKEKAMSLRFGDVTAAYEAERRGESKPVFQPGVARRTSAAALEAAAAVSNAMARQLDRVAREEVRSFARGAAGCASPWVQYCDAVQAAVSYATARGRRVAVVAQPLLRNDAAERHREQRRALAGLAERLLADNPRARYVDLSNEVDLSNPELSFDGMHLNPVGNQAIARALAAPMLAFAQAKP